MKAFQVPQRQIAVQLRLEDGKDESGTLFVPVSGPQGGPGLLSDRLNDPAERFLPLATEDGVLLVHKSRIVSVKVESGEEERAASESPGATHTEVELQTVEGAKLCGMMPFERPPARQRLVDYLNDSPQFLLVQGGAVVMLVNSERIVSVREIRSDRETY